MVRQELPLVPTQHLDAKQLVSVLMTEGAEETNEAPVFVLLLPAGSA